MTMNPTGPVDPEKYNLKIQDVFRGLNKTVESKPAPEQERSFTEILPKYLLPSFNDTHDYN